MDLERQKSLRYMNTGYLQEGIESLNSDDAQLFNSSIKNNLPEDKNKKWKERFKNFLKKTKITLKSRKNKG